ncbi:glycerol-3-phosphate acyltransferase 1, mitochondrial isoform X2 [Ambystoma mexicanum]|uniref:glycerol-3-phosphate acyltransferase 1, mitochondrial isoform X2 n=1 Tax=Ambystoma mexicanum TaxID=8296 RepID=UPI0037E7F63E
MLGNMDEATLSLGTIDASYLPNLGGYLGGGSKHSTEDWGDRTSSPTVFRSATLQWKEALMSRKRPFVGRCCYACTPQSRDKLFNPSIPSLGLRNVIYINETHTRHKGWLARRLCYVLFVQQRDVHKDMFAYNMTGKVLSLGRVQKAIHDVALETSPAGAAVQPDQKAICKVRRRARCILQEMVASISPSLLRLTCWVLLKLFNSFFWTIQVHKGQLEMVKAATEMKMPLVFLPVHKSHIDYLLLTFVLFCHNIKPPHIAAGNNLQIPIFSTLIHMLGGFFIRRRLDDTPDGRKDILYRALLNGYIQELLREQQSLEIFLEGTRSRSGKTSCGRAGLLSVVVDTVCAEAIPDVQIIPVGISYDRIIEGHYNSEQLGKPKQNESLWSIARGVFRMLRKNFGCVRMDFAQPFSLKEYLESQVQKPLPIRLSMEQALLPAILSARPTDAVYESKVALPNSRDLTDEPFRRQLIANLANHALFTANQSCAVMSTHIVACLLLYRHRQGIDLSTLVEDFFSMKEEVLARDFDLGFSGNSEDVVMHAIHLLRKSVNITNTGRNNEFFISPCLIIPDVFELNFYSNGVLHVFLMEAIIACSLQAEVSKGYTDGVRGSSQGAISQEALIRTGASLCYLLSNEGTIALPCQMFYQVCHETVERFVKYGILLVAEDDQEDVSPSLTDPSWDKKIPDHLSWRSDEEDEDSDFGEEQRDRFLKMSQTQEHQQFIAFLQRLLGPTLEAYSSAAVFIHNISGPIREKEYVQKLHKFLITRTERKVAVYTESATHCLVKNTVTTFKDIGVFLEHKQNRDTILELNDTFLPQKNRHKLLEFILRFIVL